MFYYFVRNTDTLQSEQLAEVWGSRGYPVHRILRRYNYHPFRFHVVQALRDADPEQKLEFPNTIDRLRFRHPNLLNTILWTDESKFTNNGMICRPRLGHRQRRIGKRTAEEE
uniref:Uncharacterized protein n=1 Tax=Cacopsylla melanoneura TaxID=428564 RepID=A0A8D8RRS8_9HEMI